MGDFDMSCDRSAVLRSFLGWPISASVAIRSWLLRILFFALISCLGPALCLQAEEILQPDAERAFEYLERICAIGPRISGTPGMEQQQALIKDHFTQLGAEVRFQAFDVPHPQTGQPVRMNNIVVAWHPERMERVLVSCHYDSRPYPDKEPLPINRTKSFIGANDGGSGVALLMELGHQMPHVNSRLGIDFVLFDGEELVYREGDKYFHGSEYFSKAYRDQPDRKVQYKKGILLDMVAGREMKVYMEGNSLRYARSITNRVWDIAQQLGVREFIARRKHEVRDDHLPLNQIARIPTCDIIDFDYPYWHKRNDLPAACSGESMAKVGSVVLAWLSEN